jgi:hypothetical protein
MMQLGGLLAGDPARYTRRADRHPDRGHARRRPLGLQDRRAKKSCTCRPANSWCASSPATRARISTNLELWLAPALGYLPVRIKQTQANGDFADMRIARTAAGRGAN